jgi:predicted Zn-dependent protease
MKRAQSVRRAAMALALCALAGILSQTWLDARAPGKPREAPKPASQDDVLVRAMRDELSRSMKDLRLAQLERPYFISYHVQEVQSMSVAATGGSLLEKNENRARSLRIELRVGDYAFDNTNFITLPEFSSTRSRSFFGINELPLDDNYLEIRRQIWLGTDAAYKQALEILAGKRAALQNRTRTENLADFSKEDPTQTTDVAPPLNFDPSGAELLVREMSKILSKMPDLYASTVTLNANYTRTLYLNSEGTSYEKTEPLFILTASASTQAIDGMPLGDSAHFYSRSLASFPAHEEIAAKVRAMGLGLESLRKAPQLDRYNGPVLFEARAAAEIFSAEFAPALTGQRKPVSGIPEMASVFERFLGAGSGSFADKLGARVLPEFLSVVDNPTISNYDSEILLGGYKVDVEGVRARETRVVENGILKTFLTARTPIEGVARSSGNDRGSGPAPSNLILMAGNGRSDLELKQEFLELVKKRGREYGVLVRELGSAGATTEEQTMAMISAMSGHGEKTRSVLLAYKIYQDGREELVRGVHLSGISLESFKNIVAASKSAAVYSSTEMPRINFAMLSRFVGGEMSIPIMSCVAPSLLFDDLTLTKPTGELPKPPFSTPPSYPQ